MNRHSFTRAADADAAVREKSGLDVKFIAGGTNLENPAGSFNR